MPEPCEASVEASGEVDEDRDVLVWNEAMGWIAQAQAQACMGGPMPPYWDDSCETEATSGMIHGFHTRPCEDFFRTGRCSRARGTCFDYHDESDVRRPPVDAMMGQLSYWDLPCQAYSSKPELCAAGAYCLFAHGEDEVEFHPANYKARRCDKKDCRGNVCALAHSDEELRVWAAERYSLSAALALCSAGCGAVPEAMLLARTAPAGVPPDAAGGAGGSQKHRFCASYPDVSQCRRGAHCTFAHSREEACTPLLREEEENLEPSFMTEEFFTQKFKTLWCPVGAQHDWHACVYAHTYQDARRLPSILYGPQPCPYWSKKDTRAAYAQRCPLGVRCAYSHGAKEQLYHPAYFRTVTCRDTQAKGCPRRKLCAFFHKKTERRYPPEMPVDYTKPLPKDTLPATWVEHFLAPPLFQECSDQDGGAAPAPAQPQHFRASTCVEQVGCCGTGDAEWFGAWSQGACGVFDAAAAYATFGGILAADGNGVVEDAAAHYAAMLEGGGSPKVGRG